MKRIRKITCIFMVSVASIVLVCVFVLSHATPTRAMHIAVSVCNVKTFGAAGDGTQKDTTAIQTAINTCASRGGGVVELPPGTYLSAPLFLRSNIILKVDTGATLLASTNTQDYVVPTGVTVATSMLAFINSYGINNIGITGGGVIDGQGSAWWGIPAYKDASSRPRLIELAHTNNILVTNITLQNAASMHLFLSDTNHDLVSHVTIKAPATSPNTDGIDPASSHNVLIDHCVIDTGDDNVAIKSGLVEAGYPNAGTSNVVVEHSQFFHGHGVSVGSETNGGVQNVLVYDDTFLNTTNGIRIKSTRTNGGNVSNVLYRHLTMTNVKNAIIISGYYPHIPPVSPPDPAQPITATTPNFHDITINDFVATGSTNAGNIVGLPEQQFTNITLQHVNITATTGLEVRNATLSVCDTTITATSGPSFIIEPNGIVNTCR